MVGPKTFAKIMAVMALSYVQLIKSYLITILRKSIIMITVCEKQ